MIQASGNEARQAMLDALDGMRQWCAELDAVNQRWAADVIDRVARAGQAAAWPDHASAQSGVTGKMHYFLLASAVRSHLLEACRLETDAIKEVAEGCFGSREI